MDKLLTVFNRIRKNIVSPKSGAWVVSQPLYDYLTRNNPYGKPIFDNVYKYWKAKKDIQEFHQRFIYGDWFPFSGNKVKCNCKLCSSITKVKTRTDNMADNVLSWLDLNADEVIRERAINHIRRYISSIAREQLGE